MAEAARNLDPIPESPAPQGPNLRAIEGGGQSSGGPSGNLRSVGGGQSSGRPKAPIRRGWEKARIKADELGRKSLANANRIDGFAHNHLRYEVDKDAEQKNILFPPEAPVYAAGDILDGTVLNVARRANDVLNPALGGVRAGYRTFTRPLFHPIDTLTKPHRYLANPVRGITSGVKMAKNIAMAPTRGLKDIGDRVVRRATQRFGKIPLIGPITGGVAKATSWVLEKPNQILEWPTAWVDEVDAKVAEFQNA